MAKSSRYFRIDEDVLLEFIYHDQSNPDATKPAQLHAYQLAGERKIETNHDASVDDSAIVERRSKAQHYE